MKSHWQPCRRPSIRGVRMCCLSSQEPHLITSICNYCSSKQKTTASVYPGQTTLRPSTPETCTSFPDKCLEVRQEKQLGNDSHTASDSSSMSSSQQLPRCIQRINKQVQETAGSQSMAWTCIRLGRSLRCSHRAWTLRRCPKEE